MISALIVSGALGFGTYNFTKDIEQMEQIIKKMETQNRGLQQENDKLRQYIQQQSHVLSEYKAKVNQLLDDNKKLKVEVKKLNDALLKRNAEYERKIRQLEGQLRAKQANYLSSRGDSPPSVKTIRVTATAYTAYCKGCSGKTTTGIDLRKNPDAKVVAVDPSIIPLGSKVWVEGYGYAIAADTGGGIDGYEIDVFIPNVSDAMKWGRRTVIIKILQ